MITDIDLNNKLSAIKRFVTITEKCARQIFCDLESVAGINLDATPDDALFNIKLAITKHVAEAIAELERDA